MIYIASNGTKLMLVTSFISSGLNDWQPDTSQYMDTRLKDQVDEKYQSSPTVHMAHYHEYGRI